MSIEIPWLRDRPRIRDATPFSSPFPTRSTPSCFICAPSSRCLAGQQAVLHDLLLRRKPRIQLDHKSAAGHDQNSICDLQDFVHVARNEDYGPLASVDELADHAVDLAARANVDADGWLVKDEQPAPGKKPFAKHDLLLVPATEILHLLRQAGALDPDRLNYARYSASLRGYAE